MTHLDKVLYGLIQYLYSLYVELHSEDVGR